MIDPANVPEVGEGELLARYILFSKHIRQDRTLKPDAFIPHPYLDLSVTRHLSASEGELWAVGRAVAEAQGRTLYGRGDVRCSVFTRQRLAVVPKPLDGNPNHADVSGWPREKPEQKMIALEIAAAAKFEPVDASSSG